jgi:hypothetical protein
MLTLKACGRFVVACFLCGAWLEACGQSFQAGDAASAGSSNAGASQEAGAAQGGGAADAGTGNSDAGDSSAGAAQGGGATGGDSSGGSGGAESGGAVNGGASHGGAASGGASGAGHAGSGGGLGSTNSGDCNSDAGCPNGKCIELSPGGFRTCQVEVPLATKCGLADACCPNDPMKACAAGRCVAGPVGPSCGLVQAIRNFCSVPQCTTSASCKDNGTCAQAGSLDRKEAMCLPGSCRLDKECNAAKGGKCQPVTLPCCSGVSGLYCVYPTVGCRSNNDCANGDSCQLSSDGKSAECMPGGVNCPG